MLTGAMMPTHTWDVLKYGPRGHWPPLRACLQKEARSLSGRYVRTFTLRYKVVAKGCVVSGLGAVSTILPFVLESSFQYRPLGSWLRVGGGLEGSWDPVTLPHTTTSSMCLGSVVSNLASAYTGSHCSFLAAMYFSSRQLVKGMRTAETGTAASNSAINA